MATVTVIQAAKLTGKSTQTLYRHIKQGKLSSVAGGGVDTSELIRVYGELNNDDISKPPQHNNSKSHHESANETWLKSQIEQLQLDIKELKAESLERERRLMALLEHQTGVIVEQPTGIFKKWFG